ncbi:hypothetical protein ACFL2R_04175 [Patescibacteria group bacterium]
MKKGKKIDFKKVIGSIGLYMLKKIGVFFVLFFIALSCFGIYVLYDKIHVSEWTDAEKKEYLSSMQVSAKLNKNKFEDVVSSIKKREEYVQRDLGVINDIFE